MGGYAFGHYKEPCPNCGGVVKGSFFAGDHWDYPSFDIRCSNCNATFERKKWEAFNEERHGEIFLM